MNPTRLKAIRDVLRSVADELDVKFTLTLQSTPLTWTMMMC